MKGDCNETWIETFGNVLLFCIYRNRWGRGFTQHRAGSCGILIGTSGANRNQTRGGHRRGQNNRRSGSGSPQG